MGRRSRAVEQVLSKVIEQAVSDGDELQSHLSLPDVDAAAAAAAAAATTPSRASRTSRASRASRTSRTSRAASRAASRASGASRDEASAALAEDALRKATVSVDHPQFDTSQAVMHGIAHSLNVLSPVAQKKQEEQQALKDVPEDESHPQDKGTQERHDSPSSEERDRDSSASETSVHGSMSIGRAPSSAFFRPHNGLTLKQFREAITHQHEVHFAVGKGGKPLGKPSLSSRNVMSPRAAAAPAPAPAPAEAASAADEKEKAKGKSRSMRFAFKTYAGVVFSHIRASLNIDSASYVQSLAGGEAFLDFVSNSKSGQFFFFTDDKRYMIKTMSQQESLWFRMFLPDYYQHLSDNPSSMLVRIVGLYRLQCRGRSKLHFMVMRNVFVSPLPIHVRFDLKGSQIGRQVSPAERRRSKAVLVLKDLDFDHEHVMLDLGPHRAAFVKQLRSDSAFLSRTTLMDYSMLVGIYRRSLDRSSITDAAILRNCGLDPDVPDSEHPFSAAAVVSRGEDGRIREVYFFGIIDFLQKYNWRKKAEHFFKSLRFDSTKISAVHPRRYATRFCQFIEQHLK